MNEQAKAQVEAIKAQARGRRETGETLGTLIGAGAGALMSKEGERLQGAALGAGIGQAAGGQLSGAVRQPGVTTGADLGVQALQQGVTLQQQKELLKKKQAKEEREEKKFEMEEEKFDFDKKMKEEKLELEKEELEIKKQQEIGKATKEKAKKLSENLKKQEDLEKKRVATINDARAVKSTSASIDNVIRQIDELFADPSGLKAAVGGTGLINRRFPGTKSRSIAGKIETVLANAAFSTLQDMREKSKTGGALGQVSERELAQLERAIGNLDVGQSDEEFMKNLRNVRNRFVEMKNLSTDTFKQIHGDDAFKQFIGSDEKPKKRRKYNPETGRLE